ncbi:MAG: ABC transporter substrate-binding protein, partial [Thermoplasmata archaeon]|nr:ABC transporter substrate-binding protein [Thermoplasmata archaeon]
MQDEVPVRKRFPRKVISVAIVIIVLAGALFSYSLLSARDAPVKIGVILPMTGPYAYMAEVKDNLEMAVNEINEWSGLNDRPIELIIADCQSDSDVAADLFREMENEHHPFAYIAVTSSVYIALAPLAEEAHVVLL